MPLLQSSALLQKGPCPHSSFPPSFPNHSCAADVAANAARLQGNLVNAFGFGARKDNAMALIDSFEPVYCLKQLRVAGDELRLLRAYPGKWQVTLAS